MERFGDMESIMGSSPFSNNDRDIGWMQSSLLVACTCKHMQTSHRPISKKCSRCDCPAFTPAPPPAQ
jgi:hypothetical protein